MLKIVEDVYSLAASGTLDGLKQALQFAVELEHATMPPYLYARYSIATSADNRAIARVLREVVREEMHHMLLAGNLLKAIGGTPAIDTPAFVPSFPTHLPGTVASDLIVPLAPFSKALVSDVFMRIEEPRQILEFPVLATDATEPARTIGDFYARIREAFEAGGDDLIVDKTGTDQPMHFDMPELQTVTTAAEALAAIDLIVEQGEGTESEPTFPDGDGDPENDDLAHYYRFAEIVKGKLKANPNATDATPPDQRYFYDANDPIDFNPGEVLPLRTNPKAAEHAAGSPARTATDAFNRLYTDLLGQLHASFNGEPGKMFDAVDSMNGLGRLAGEIIAIGTARWHARWPKLRVLPRTAAVLGTAKSAVPGEIGAEPTLEIHEEEMPMVNFLNVQRLLDRLLGGATPTNHGEFWRGKSLEDLIARIADRARAFPGSPLFRGWPTG